MRRLLSVGAGTAVALLLAAPAGAANWTAGSDGLGDPFFPQAGNGGYASATTRSTLATTRPTRCSMARRP